MGEEKRENLMESLFGEESDDDADAAASYSEEEGEGEGEAEGGGAESGGDREESEGEREASEGDKEESEHERVSRRSSDDGGGEEGSAASGSENDGQVQEREATRSEEVEEQRGARIRAALGDSDDDDQEEGGVDGPRKPSSPEGEGSDLEGSYHKDSKRGAEDDEEQYYSDEERAEIKKPKGEPLTVEVPLRQPPTQAHNMNLVRISNIMDIEQRPFDPKTYVEEDGFVDETGRRRIRIEENVVRWRYVRNRDGSRSAESNARFVKWSDGSMQLLLGNEVLDLAVQDGQQDESHLFIRQPKGLLQAQGRLARKMRFMPSSLRSKSHRLLTALVDSTHKKVFKVKNVITDFDPEKDKEQKEKAAEQRIKSKEDLQKKQEKTMRKYPPTREREPQLSPGYLEGALEEEDEDYDDEGRSNRRYQDQLDAESRAERRINQVKRQPPKAMERRPSSRSRRDILEDEDSDESDRNRGARGDEGEEEQEDDEGEEEEEEVEARDSRRKRKDRDREQLQQQQNSPPRKQQTHRRRAVVSDSDED
ncbi:protein LEO1 homolog [Selaginella moellendorffii]|uniref:protein LEO1 homolog n=1 Tax=Selaginella moellendorffii TaxID=88036 RepID=UPI000D1C5AE3|nr:protein LEO1 homolog [Selaginella moellendorffii]|eukprot:XP_024516325.1 protein LEO1 homolog [Selaginella moellendorffii]